ncbi:MAG: hypothetical protein E7420_07810 [Ruminococcaceae bacterium]|nr:hypothetical protein [Oscillospiraceae bacterium]
MESKAKRIYLVSLLAAVFFGLSIFAIFKTPDEYSLSERRKLEQMPEISIKTILNGRFMEDFEDYSLDQFPLRDSFRSLKAFTSLKIMGQTDSNGLYIHNHSVAKKEYPLNYDSLDYASLVFSGLYNRFLAGKADKIGFVIVPDKNFYLADDAGMLHMDYDEFYSTLEASTSHFAEHIDIRNYLDINDYYLTDTHWRQENILPAAQEIAAAFGNTLPENYEKVLVDEPFKGVYFSQLGLKLDTEELYYLTNGIIENYSVFNFESNKAIPVYDTSLAAGADPYEMFLSGPLSLVTIENPSVNTQKELIIFRDSFGSAIAPLLAQSYAKTTIIDVRYIQPMVLGNFVDFENADVLFLYSSMVLNNSTTLKQ